MHKVRVGSLNINGGGDQLKRVIILKKMVTQKKLDVVFLQETQWQKLR